MAIDPTLQIVILGTSILGFVSGCLGTFAVLRKQSLMGDAVSHAALPGVVIAFLLVGKVPIGLVIGAAFAGWIAMLAVSTITKNSRIPFDSALAGTLAVFFGLGLMLMSKIHNSAGIDRYLFGQAATILSADVTMIAILGTVAIAITLIFWKEFKLISFDRGFAIGLGLPIFWLDLLLTGLMVLAVVIGLESVGVVLMSSLLVAPAVAARQWTNKLSVMVFLAGIFGAISGATGTILSHVLSNPARKISIPTGPTIVLCATLIVVLSLSYKTLSQLRNRTIAKANPWKESEFYPR